MVGPSIVVYPGEKVELHGVWSTDAKQLEQFEARWVCEIVLKSVGVCVCVCANLQLEIKVSRFGHVLRL